MCKNARHLLTFSILWTLSFPEFGLPSFSPEIISSSRMSSLPSLKSVKILLICKTSMLIYDTDAPACKVHEQARDFGSDGSSKTYIKGCFNSLSGWFHAAPFRSIVPPPPPSPSVSTVACIASGPSESPGGPAYQMQ